jgi:hypothetical protein
VSAIRPDWARLFRIACSLIRQVNSEQLIIDSWSFGGGTPTVKARSYGVFQFLQLSRE